MSQRTDIHCPSRIQPQDYTYVGMRTAPRSGLSFHHFVMTQHQIIRAHMERTGGDYATHEHGGNCMSCGAHCVYMAVFYHPKSNDYIATGLDCAEKIGIGDPNAFRVFTKAVDAARHHLAGKRKAQGILEQRKLDNAWHLYLLLTDIPAATRHLGFTADTPVGILADFCEETGLEQALVLRSLAQSVVPTREMNIVTSMVARLVKYGSLSDATWRYLRGLMDTIEGKTPTPAPQVSIDDEKPSSPRSYTVQSRQGRRSVESPFSNNEALALLPATDSFAQDLKAQKLRQGSLSYRQWAWVHVLAVEGVQKQQEEEQRLQQAEAVVRDEVQMGRINEMFEHAKSHLKRPRIRLAVEVTASGAEPGSPLSSDLVGYYLYPAKKDGWLNLKSETREFIGQISSDGLLIPARETSLNNHPGLVEMLRRLSDNPAQVASEYGKLMCQCCFCGLTLSDPRSTEVGYGPICAVHYHIPWGSKDNGFVEKVGKLLKSEPLPAPVAEQRTEAPQTPQVGTEQLSYDSLNRLFTGKASDLGLAAGQWPKSIEVKSAKTGVVKTFQFAEEHWDKEHEVTSGDYTCEGLTLRLLND